ncbi:hypothetical protein [Aureimonas sp. AU12]|uniref:hypothetical protein n=1 Tax=Aureimonas sp. AU12 TaxID=1638161 RepID=UPI000780C876|nr:hypothetical protein [Aureimonas sp. AU12]
MTDENGTQAPIDPAFERVRRKMVRLLALSIAVLFVGLIAVLSAVVYRSSDRPAETAAAPAGATQGLTEGNSAPILLPAGARIAESALDANHALIRIALAGGGEELLIVDLATGEVVSRYPIRVEGAASPAPATTTP